MRCCPDHEGSYLNLAWVKYPLPGTANLETAASKIRVGGLDDLYDRDALAILGRAPNPIQAVGLSSSKVRSALKAAGRQRDLVSARMTFRPPFGIEQLVAPCAVTAAFAASARVMFGILAE